LACPYKQKNPSLEAAMKKLRTRWAEAVMALCFSTLTAPAQTVIEEWGTAQFPPPRRALAPRSR
jgi:hypothetical protein